MKFNKSRGAASRVIVILAVVVLLAIIIVYFGLKFTTNKNNPSSGEATPTTDVPVVPPMVYEKKIGDIDFTMVLSQDLGRVLVDNKSGYKQDAVTTEKFIKVVINAKNIGKINTNFGEWRLGNIIDSEGRIFNEAPAAYYFLPKPDGCGAILKPDFSPIQCVRIYEVAKASNKLSVEIYAPAPKGSKVPELLDLKLQ